MVFSNVSHNIITIRNNIITIHCISYNTAQYATRTAGKQMDRFWDSNMTDPWDCWSICDFDLPLCTPSNQVQESWHNQILKAKIPGMFKGSTESVIKVALPQLVRMDGYFMPTILPFYVSCPTHPCSTACH